MAEKRSLTLADLDALVDLAGGQEATSFRARVEVDGRWTVEALNEAGDLVALWHPRYAAAIADLTLEELAGALGVVLVKNGDGRVTR